MSMPHPSRNDPPPVCEYGGRCKPGECSGPCGNDPRWTGPRWTEDTLRIVARQDRLHRIDFARADARCTCHAWTMPVPYNAVDAHASHERHRAHALLTALADAGLLTLGGAEREQLPVLAVDTPVMLAGDATRYRVHRYWPWGTDARESVLLRLLPIDPEAAP